MEGVGVGGDKSAVETYHHGNLKEALVNACMTLMQTTVPDKISLRRVAAEVGVAPAAVYNHFSDKTGLMVAVKMRCLRHMADYLEAHASDRTQPPRERICALGLAYSRYSATYPGFYNIIFFQDIPADCMDQAVLDSYVAAGAAAQEAIEALLDQHGLDRTPYFEGLGVFAGWALAHGIAELARQRFNPAACAPEQWPAQFSVGHEQGVESTCLVMANILIEGLLATAAAGAERIDKR